MRLFAQLLGLVLAAGIAVAQPTTKPDKPKASAVKLPDGTIVFVTRSAEDPNPIVDGVVLSPAEYQAMLDQVEAAKKAKEANKPVPPSGVAIRGTIEARGERAVAALTLTFTFRTSLPRTSVTLGCQRAAVVSAKMADGKLPILTADADGLIVLAENAGEHTVTVQVEVPVSPRATKGEIGFEFGLPKAAISTFGLTKPPSDGVAKVSIGSRGDAPATLKRTIITTDQLVARPIALGPTDILEVSWEPPGTAPSDPGLTADADVQVRVDDTQVETVAKLRLKGTTQEWQLTLPIDAEVSVATGGPLPLPSFTTTVIKPAEATKPWVIRTPADTPGDWLVSVSVRQPRPKPTDPKFRGPYAVGPFLVAGAQPTVKMSVHAPAGIRLGFKPGADFRRQDLPATADDNLVAVFTTPSAPKAGSWLDIDARPAVGPLRVRPQHKLRLTNTGWKLESTIRVVPGQRTELEQLSFDMPTGWTAMDVGPAEFAEVSPEGSDGRTHTVRFTTPQKAAFEFTLTAVHPVPTPGTASLQLPRFPQAEERETKLTAIVSDGLEISGTGFGWENGQPGTNGEPLKSVGRGAATTSVSGEFDSGVSRAELRWQPYRPELACDSLAEVTVHPRQLSVTQTLKFTAPEGDVKVVSVRGPEDLVGLRAKPGLEAVGRGEWEYRPTADPGREFTITVQFAVPLPPGATTVVVPLLWCGSATRSEAVVRVWSGGGPRAEGIVGRWRETPPEPIADRDSLPWFTLHANAPEPLTLTLSDRTDIGGGTVIDRGLILAAVGADGTAAVRAMYAVRRWSGGGVELDLPADSLKDVLVDGIRAEPVRVGERMMVPMPEGKPGVTAILDVRCQGVAAADGGGRVISPPAVRGASYRGPVRWHVACPGECVPLVFDAGWDTEHRWVWRGYGVGPGPVDSPADMEQWLRGGVDSDDANVLGGDGVAVRRATADPLRITLAPRWAWILIAGMMGLLVTAGIGQLRLTLIGPAVAVVAVVLAAGAVFLPQPSAQAVAAAQPGLALGAVVLLTQHGWRWYRSWMTDRRSTFSRTLPTTAEPVVPPSARAARSGAGDSVVPFESRPS